MIPPKCPRGGRCKIRRSKVSTIAGVPLVVMSKRGKFRTIRKCVKCGTFY